MPRTPTSPARRLIGAAAALAVALAGMTATAVPARAQGDDLLRLFLGAAAIAVIGSAIAGANQPPRPPVYPVYPPYPPRPVGPPYPPPRPVPPPRPHPPVAYIPAHCEIRVGNRSYFGDVCLARAGLGGRLPGACARQVQTPRGWRTAYDGACLRQYGWRN